MNGKDRCMDIWFEMTWLMTELLKLFLHNNRDKMDWNGFFPRRHLVRRKQRYTDQLGISSKMAIVL